MQIERKEIEIEIEGEQIKTYGFRVYDEVGTECYRIDDISSNMQFVDDIIFAIKSGKTSLYHIHDIVEDAVSFLEIDKPDA